jgi:hypothetical protein
MFFTLSTDSPRRPCRVCGHEFTPSRFDQRVCTDTCRQRLHRGGDLAYLADLDPKPRRAARAQHVKIEREIAERKAANAAERKARRARSVARWVDGTNLRSALLEAREIEGKRASSNSPSAPSPESKPVVDITTLSPGVLKARRHVTELIRAMKQRKGFRRPSLRTVARVLDDLEAEGFFGG